MTLETLITVLKNTGIPLFHNGTKSLPKLPYMVYTEYMERYRKADNRITDTVVSVQIDLYEQIGGSRYEDILNALDEAEIPLKPVVKTVETDADGKNGVSAVERRIFDCEVFKSG